MANVPAAPGRLTTLIRQPVTLDISPASVRSTLSVPPPGAYITTSVIGRSGHCAAAGIAVRKLATSAAEAVTGINFLMDFYTLQGAILYYYTRLGNHSHDAGKVDLSRPF